MGMDEPIMRAEYEEFSKRVDEENRRQNGRISELEKTVKQINELTVSVGRMAVNMENMLDVLKQQGNRLDKLEGEPAEAGRQIKNAAITAFIGAVIGAIVTAVFALM